MEGESGEQVGGEDYDYPLCFDTGPLRPSD